MADLCVFKEHLVQVMQIIGNFRGGSSINVPWFVKIASRPFQPGPLNDIGIWLLQTFVDTGASPPPASTMLDG